MRRAGALVLFGIVVGVASLSPLAQRGPASPVWPGYKGDNLTLLPNGWHIAPEGRHITVRGHRSDSPSIPRSDDAVRTADLVDLVCQLGRWCS